MEMKVLGIDFGLRKIGLAVSEGMLAEPLTVIRHQVSVIEKIAALCQRDKIERIVIGLPGGKMAKQVRRFGCDLSKRISQPIVYQEEVLTTQEAIAKMIESGRGKKYRQEMEDAFAAALILQAYLDSLGGRRN